MKVVMRRSGGRFVDQTASSKPVYLSLDSTEELWAGLVQLLPGLLPGEAALLEGFCPPLKPQAILEVRTWEEYTGKGAVISQRKHGIVTVGVSSCCASQNEVEVIECQNFQNFTRIR